MLLRKIDPNNPEEFSAVNADIWAELRPMLYAGDVELTIEKPENAYTAKQRGALHIWCSMCADVLNAHGITCKRLKVFGDDLIEIPWTMELFKEIVYKPVLAAMTGKKSTEDQSTVNPGDVALVIARQYAQNGLQCPEWPSRR